MNFIRMKKHFNNMELAIVAAVAIVFLFIGWRCSYLLFHELATIFTSGNNRCGGFSRLSNTASCNHKRRVRQSSNSVNGHIMRHNMMMMSI